MAQKVDVAQGGRKTYKPEDSKVVIYPPFLLGGFLEGPHVNPKSHDDGAKDGEDVCQDLGRESDPEWLDGWLVVGDLGNLSAGKVVDGSHRGDDSQRWRTVTDEERDGVLHIVISPYFWEFAGELPSRALEKPSVLCIKRDPRLYWWRPWCTDGVSNLQKPGLGKKNQAPGSPKPNSWWHAAPCGHGVFGLLECQCACIIQQRSAQQHRRR